jgi:hypothetical protein
MSRPSDAVIFERAKSFANEAIFTVALQHRRLQTTEPEDNVFIFRWHADFQFFTVALRRLRRAVELAAEVSHLSDTLRAEIKAFDSRLPALVKSVAGVNYFFRRRQLFLPVLSLHHWSTIAQSDAKSVRSSGSEISARFRS